MPMQQYISAVVDAHKKAWRTVRITIKIAAYASLLLNCYVGWEVTHGKIFQFDGVAHAELPFGNPQQAIIAQLPADQVLPPQATQAIPDTKTTRTKLAAEGPRPAEKPPAPQKQN
jgi:hypothetical protein